VWRGADTTTSKRSFLAMVVSEQALEDNIGKKSTVSLFFFFLAILEFELRASDW
jgi:hypothetical protein